MQKSSRLIMTPIQISDGAGLTVDLLDYGARIVQINAAGLNLACSYDDLAQFAQDPFYLGATIGPITNRIKDGKLSINEQAYQMPTNEGNNTLHSGGAGFDKEIWQITEQSSNSATFELSYDLAKAGMHGILRTITRYTVGAGTLRIEYQSSCDQTTYINLTNHVYLNLSGTPTAIDDHEFTLFADAMVMVDDHNIPTGEIKSLEAPWAYSIARTPELSELEGLCDHHFNVAQADDSKLKVMLQACSKTSGMQLEVRGNSPGFQFYTGKSLSSPFVASGGFCVETQLAPDAINQTNFYSPLLIAGDSRHQITELQFSQILTN